MRFYRVKLLRTAAKETKQQIDYRQTLLAGNHFESLCFPEKQGKRSIGILAGVDWRGRLEVAIARWQKRATLREKTPRRRRLH